MSGSIPDPLMPKRKLFTGLSFFFVYLSFYELSYYNMTTKTKLKTVHKFNKTLIDDLFNIVINNPEQKCLLDNYKPITPVSVSLINFCTHKEKIFKLLLKNKIYNILYLNIKSNQHLFKCKFSTGKILSYEISMSECKSKKEAFQLALLYFIEIDSINFL